MKRADGEQERERWNASRYAGPTWNLRPQDLCFPSELVIGLIVGAENDGR